MLAANTDVTYAFNCPYENLQRLKLFFFEYGMILNDRLAAKLSMVPLAANNKELFTKLQEEIDDIIAPDRDKTDKNKLDERQLGLMKELENTIVTFDRESVRDAAARSETERMKI